MKISADIHPTRWPEFTHRIYDFENGYGARLVIPPATLTVETSDGPVEYVKAWELHPLEIPRFRDPVINYAISPPIEVTKKTLDAALAQLEAATA